MSTPPLIFLVDDEPAIAEAVGYALRAEGFRCQHHANGGACLAALDGERPALALLAVLVPLVAAGCWWTWRGVRRSASATAAERLRHGVEQ
jgi:DNA-binding response OmpR family regulator